MRIISIFIFQR